MGAKSTAVGNASTATGTNSFAAGNTSSAAGASSVAIGDTAGATGTNGIAIGTGAASGPGTDAIAIGTGALSTGSVAIGSAAAAALEHRRRRRGHSDRVCRLLRLRQRRGRLRTNSTALGSGAVASATNSVALGANSVATRANTVSVGTLADPRQITNVAPGTFGTDAVNVNQLNQAVGSVRTEERRGIAAVSAMPPMLTPSAPGKFTLAVGGGAFQNQFGIGVTGAYRLPTAIPSYLSASYANGGGNESVFRVMGGAEFEFYLPSRLTCRYGRA